MGINQQGTGVKSVVRRSKEKNKGFSMNRSKVVYGKRILRNV